MHLIRIKQATGAQPFGVDAQPPRSRTCYQRACSANRDLAPVSRAGRTLRSGSAALAAARRFCGPSRPDRPRLRSLRRPAEGLEVAFLWACETSPSPKAPSRWGCRPATPCRPPARGHVRGALLVCRPGGDRLVAWVPTLCRRRSAIGRTPGPAASGRRSVGAPRSGCGRCSARVAITAPRRSFLWRSLRPAPVASFSRVHDPTVNALQPGRTARHLKAELRRWPGVRHVGRHAGAAA